MSNKLRRIFMPTDEEKLEDYRKYLKMIQGASDCCLNCIHCMPPDPMLPSFVTDYGDCAIDPDHFTIRGIGCDKYHRDTTGEENLAKLIRELESKIEKGE